MAVFKALEGAPIKILWDSWMLFLPRPAMMSTFETLLYEASKPVQKI